MYRNIEPEEVKIDKTLGYSYFLDKAHPLSSKDVGRVYYHRHVASISIGRWLDKDEVVHHIDGNKQNNSPENLKVLSVVDHALLHSTERGNAGKKTLTCPVCSKEFEAYDSLHNIRVHCSEKCAQKASIKWNITKEELEILIWNMSYVTISSKYNISDVGAKKRAKALNCKMPPPYFFNKTESYRKEQRTLNNIPDLPTQQSSKLLT